MAEPESPAFTAHLMEAICDLDNIEALGAVVRNEGTPGVDSFNVNQLPGIQISEERRGAPG